MQKLQLDDFDGGFVIAPWERFKELVDWYSTHLDLKITYEEDHPIEKMASLAFPALGAIHVKAVEYSHPHFTVDWGRNGNVRFCFSAPRIEETHTYMIIQNIPASSIETTPYGRRFDFYDPIGNRLTAVEPEESMNDLVAKAPHARFPFQGLPRFGVPQLDEAIKWYSDNLGGKVLHRSDDDKSAVVVITSEGCPVFLETVAADNDQQDANAHHLCVAARPYWVIRKKTDFFATHKQLQEHGFDVTEYAGNPKYLVLFHTYDPYGNQINVWSYEDC